MYFKLFFSKFLTDSLTFQTQTQTQTQTKIPKKLKPKPKLSTQFICLNDGNYCVGFEALLTQIVIGYWGYLTMALNANSCWRKGQILSRGVQKRNGENKNKTNKHQKLIWNFEKDNLKYEKTFLVFGYFSF